MISTLKPYTILSCNNTKQLSAEIYNYVEQQTDILSKNVLGWNFLNAKELLKSAPELVKFFTAYKLYVRDAAVTVVTSDNDLPLHMDTLPVVAKINIPVLNTKGWSNQWYSIDPTVLKSVSFTKDQFGNQVEDLKLVPASALTLMAEIADLETPIVFNSRIPHCVVKVGEVMPPRIVASFTFFNEPVELLQ